MSQTVNLKLYKHDEPLKSNTNPFDVDKALNDNWDIVDNAYKEIKDNINSLDNRTEILEDDNASNKTNISTLQEKVTNLEKDNTDNKSNITNLQKDVEDLGKDIEENTTNIETLQAENKNLKEEVESYKNSLPREKQEGEYITMQNTADKVRFKDFVLGGNSKQESRGGKNKFNKDENATILSYVTEEKIENGIKLNVNNITSQWAVARYNIADVSNLIGKTVRLKAEFTNSNANGGYYIILANAETQKTVVDPTQNSGEVLSYVIKEEDVAEYPILRIGLRADDAQEGGYVDYENIIVTIDDEDMSYEEYGATPSPEIPSKIENVEGDVEVTVANKNIANAEQLYQDMLAFNPNVRKKVVDGRNCILFSNMLFMYSKGFRGLQGIYKKNTRYVIRAMCRVQDTSIVDAKSLMIDSHDEKGNLTGYFTSAAKGKNWIQFSFLTNAGASVDCISFSYGNNTMWYLDMDSLEIYEATKVEDFVANEQQTVVFPLAQGQKLMLNDYLANDGIHHVRKQVELNGTEDITINHAENNVFKINNILDIGNNGSTQDIFGYYCTHFKEKTHVQVRAGSIGFCALGEGVNAIYLGFGAESTVNSIENCKTYLAEQKQAGTPVILEYELAEEEIEPYTNEQKQAYNKLKQLTTYAGQTNIYSTNSPSPIFTVTGIKDVNSMLTQVNKLILENGGN